MRRASILVLGIVLLPACIVLTDDVTSMTGEFGDEFGTDDDTSGTSTAGDGDATTTADTTTGDGDTTTTTTTTDDGDTTTTTTGDPENPYDAAAQHCVDTINMYRATLGLPAYERWVDAEVCSGDEAESDSISQTPHGAFGQCGEWAQNECPGWPGPPEQLLDGCLAQMWAEGPGEPFSEHGHYINMSSTDYTKVACGFFETAQGDYWAVQNFQ